MYKLLCMLLLSSILAEDLDYIDTLDDHFNFGGIHLDELTNIMKCLVDEGPCTEVYASWRKHYPAVVIEGCSRCNVHQRRILGVLLKRLKKDLPSYYITWKKFNDPEDKYFDNFEKAALDD